MNNFEYNSHYLSSFKSNVLMGGWSASWVQGNSQSFRMAHWLSSCYDGSSQLNVAHWLWLPIPMALFKYRQHCLDAFSPRWLLLVTMLVMAHYCTWWLPGSSWLVMESDGFWHLLTAFNGLHFPPPTPDGCVWVHMVYEGSIVHAGSRLLQIDCDCFQVTGLGGH